jgi:GDP-L-fucose synthase
MLTHINVGCGHDLSIKELAETIARVVQYSGEITFDASKPDGAPRKLMDSSRLNALGHQHHVGLVAGLEVTYQDFLKNHAAQS